MTDPLRAKAEAMAADLISGHCGLPSWFMEQMKEKYRDIERWSRGCLVDRIYKHLLEMEEERKA